MLGIPWKSDRFKEPESGYVRLDSQVDWYDKKSQAAQRNYKLSKLAIIIAAAAIPVLSIDGYVYTVAAFGALIAIAEGLQHLNQWHHNWITYRATCEALRHEKFTYIERANPYEIEDDVEARRLLVERVESLISTEHSKWIAAQEDSAKSDDGNQRSPRSPN